jgi:hypothetical protein
MLTFKIRGSVRVAESGQPLSGFWVKAYDKDLLYDDLLGTALLDAHGTFELVADAADFRDFFDVRPDLYLKVLAPDRRHVVFSTESCVRWHAGRLEHFEVLVPGRALGEHVRSNVIRLQGEDGAERSVFEVGEVLSLAVSGVRPVSVFSARLEGEDGRELFTDRLLSDRRGAIEPTVIWPQMGLYELESPGRLTVAEAHSRWAGRRLVLRLLHGEQQLARSELAFSSELSRPLVLSTDAEGRLLNGFELGRHDAVVSLHQAPFDGVARVYLVPRQHDWRPGDPFAPVKLATGRLAFSDVVVPKVGGSVTTRLAEAKELVPGAYDFIVRRLRYGYEDDDDFVLRREDLVSGRHITGLVVRHEFWANKPIKGGCINALDMAARRVSGAPYVHFSNVFQEGEDVFAALDPALLDPSHTGKMMALYVVPHKTAAEWSADGSLQHLAALGGNAGVQLLLTQPDCVNMNLRLLWPGATSGEFDIVADFGAGGSPETFVSDATYTMPGDIIDGYFQPGFRVVPDPTVDTSFSHTGHFAYDETTAGYADGNPSRPLRALVYFPADAPGATTVAGLSAVASDYPLIIVAHGKNNLVTDSHLGFEYLVEHLARNGFVVASISAESAEDSPDATAYIIRAQIEYLNSLFGSGLADNVGLLGHSRGGEGVSLAAQHNHTLGWGLAINAVIALAPTDFFHPTLDGSWAPPWLGIYGSLDGDVAGIGNTGFRIYDRASGAEKSFVFVYGACHSRFNTLWGDEFEAGDAGSVISSDAHKNILLGWSAAFFRLHLRAESQWAGIFRGEWLPRLAETTDPKAKFYVQYHHPDALTIDDFEGTHTATSWTSSTIGGAVSRSALFGDPSEGALATLDSHSPHLTAGLLLGWTAAAGHLNFEIPAAYQNVMAFAVLSFRITQKVGSLWNTPGLAQDLRVVLTDGSGHSRAVMASKFGEIPAPHARATAFLTKSALRTVRIPLTAYTIRCLGVAEVDLSNVISVGFDFSVVGSGEIEIDSVAFSQ